MHRYAGGEENYRSKLSILPTYSWGGGLMGGLVQGGGCSPPPPSPVPPCGAELFKGGKGGRRFGAWVDCLGTYVV